MARERWFYAKDMRRMGPLPRRQLVQSLLGLPDPRAVLIWRHGLPAWTAARAVPEIDSQLAPFARAEAPAAERALLPTVSPGTPGVHSAPAPRLRVPGDEGRAVRAQQPSVALYFGALGVLLLVVVVGWLVWPRSNDNAGPAPAAVGGPNQGGTLVASPRAAEASSTETAPGAGAPGLAGGSDQEVDLPPAELRLLKGVGGWSGSKLTVTLYNGSAWRITEILVRTSRLRGDEFVDAETPHRLLPLGGAPTDAGTVELLKKVAPERKKPGVNPLDTGPFEATVGAQPEAYRWRIEGARGYPPRAGS